MPSSPHSTCLALDDAEAAFLLAVLTGTEAGASIDAQGGVPEQVPGLAKGPLASPCLTARDGAIRNTGNLLASASSTSLLVSGPHTSTPCGDPAQPRQSIARHGVPCEDGPRLRSTRDLQPGHTTLLAPREACLPAQTALNSTRTARLAESTRRHAAQATLRPCGMPTPRPTATGRSPSQTLTTVSSDVSSGTCSGISSGTASGASRGSVTDGSTGSARRVLAALAPRPLAASSSSHDGAALPPPTRAHPLRHARGLLQQALQLESELQHLLASASEQRQAPELERSDSGSGSAAQLATARGQNVWSGGTSSLHPHSPAAAPPPQSPHPPHPDSRRQGWQPAAPTPASFPLAQPPTQAHQQPQPQPHQLEPPLHAALHSLAERLCAAYNSSAVALLEAGLGSEARQQLDKAALLAGPEGPLAGHTGKQRELQAVVHNNFACYYRRLQQPETALEHLRLAAELETAAAREASSEGTLPCSLASPGSNDCDGARPCSGGGTTAAALQGLAPESGCGSTFGGACEAAGPSAATLLNMAACCSSLGRHGQALAHAEQAVWAAARELRVPLAALESALQEGLGQAQLWEALPQLRHADRAACTQVAMAYYNRAVEQEHMQQWAPALESYRLAVHAASRFVGRAAEVTLTMQQSAEAFKVRLRRLERQGKLHSFSTNQSPSRTCGPPGARRSSGGGGSGRGASPAPLPPAPVGVPPEPLPSRQLRATSSASAASRRSLRGPTGAGPGFRPEGLPAIRRPASLPTAAAFAASDAPSVANARDAAVMSPCLLPAPETRTLGTRRRTTTALEEARSSRSVCSEASLSHPTPLPQRPSPSMVQVDQGPADRRADQEGTGTGGLPAQEPPMLKAGASWGARLPVALSTGRATMQPDPAGPGPPDMILRGLEGKSPSAQNTHEALLRPAPGAALVGVTSLAAPQQLPAGAMVWDSGCGGDGILATFPAAGESTAAAPAGEARDAAERHLEAGSGYGGSEAAGCFMTTLAGAASADQALYVSMPRPQVPVPIVGPPVPAVMPRADESSGIAHRGSCKSVSGVEARTAGVPQGVGWMLKPKRDGLAV